MKIVCHCTAAMVCEEADEASPQEVRLVFVCPDCHSETTISGATAEIETALDRPVWTNQARHRLDRIPPFAWPAFQEEAEAYAQAKGLRLMTAALLDESRQKGTMAWTPEATRRLDNIPEAVRAMARTEIERMARERGETTVSEALMDEAKGKFLGFRGPSRPTV